MKRIFELNHHDIMNMKKNDLVNIIKNSEGRTIMAETVISCESLIYGVSNPELAASFGADMITLNTFDFTTPFIFGFEELKLEGSNVAEITASLSKAIEANRSNKDYIRKFKDAVGRFLGVNMEPVPEGINYPDGLKLNKENLNKVLEFGFDYIVITGNPNTGITTKTIIEGIKEARNILGDNVMIIAGKMHGAGGENIYDEATIREFAKSGADAVLIPAPGTVPGFDLNISKKLIDCIHEEGKIAMTAFGTSQEGSQQNVIENIAITSKMAGTDIQHIGDAGFSGMALPENIMAMSIAVRGKRHTYRRMGYSINK